MKSRSDNSGVANNSAKSYISINSAKSYIPINSAKSFISINSGKPRESTAPRSVLFTIITVAVMFSLFATLALTAHADSAVKIADMINDYAYFGSGALTAEASGNTVVITGSATSGGRILNFNFDPGVTVIWKADYTSSEINAISINGEGVFELPDGGIIAKTGNVGNAVTINNSAVMTFNISGGEVHSEDGGINGGTKGAIINVSDGLVETRRGAISAQRGKIHISGGLVTSSEGVGISNLGGDGSVTISGGTVRCVNNVVITSGLDDTVVTISGGLVENADTGYQTVSAKNFVMTGGEVKNPSAELRPGQPGGGAAVLISGDCDISGGVIGARAGTAIYTNGVDYNIKAQGGFVFAYGTSVLREGLDPVETRVIPGGSKNPTSIGGSAVVCAWNQAAGRSTYTAGTADDLVVAPSGASAVWGLEDGESGIKYANGANTGFYPLEGVTVVASGTTAQQNSESTGQQSQSSEQTGQPDADADVDTDADTDVDADTGANADTTTSASQSGSGYTWSNASDWAVPELQKAAELGLIPASLDGADFTQPITRAEFAAVSVKVYESLSGQAATPASPNPFSDTSDVEVLKAVNVGLTAGTSATTFEPKLLLNREQAATMLARVYKCVALDGWTLDTDADFPLPYTRQAPFADDASISEWARDSVYFMVSKKIINGLGNNLFGPKNTTAAEEAANYANATREQALLIAARMAENLN